MDQGQKSSHNSQNDTFQLKNHGPSGVIIYYKTVIICIKGGLGSV